MFVSANGIVHGDVACRNILVSTEPPANHSSIGRGVSRVTLKLADFGLSTHAADEQYVEIDLDASNGNNQREARLAAAWPAPEVLARRDFSTKSDVYELPNCYGYCIFYLLYYTFKTSN